MALSWLLPAVALLAAGCGTPGPPAPGFETRAADSPPAAPRPAGRVFTVNPEASELRIVVFAAGRLAALGHPHVIGGQAVEGRIWLGDSSESAGLALDITVPALMVDAPEWRADEGFEPDMPESAIAGTRRNLLGPEVLDADNHPVVAVRSAGLLGPRWQPDVEIEITLRGVSRALTVPVAVTLDDDRLIAIGRLTLRQSDFGITPFTAAGGALAVADEVLVRFRIVAHATSSGADTP